MIAENVRLQLFREVVACTRCPLCDARLLRDDSFNLPQPGYIGQNYSTHRVLLIGQNPGVSPDRFAHQDAEYARLQCAMRDEGSSEALAALESHIRKILPTWPVCGNYFPLTECGLTLEDIAYFNLVRCRTRDNAAPSDGMTGNCAASHLGRWIEILSPSVIVCIGKWAFSNLPGSVRDRYLGRIGFMNRQRSLASSERDQNRRSVVELVRGYLGTDSVTAPQASVVEVPAEHNAAVRSLNAEPPATSRYQFKSCYKSDRFSHTEIRCDGATIAHCTKGLTTVFPSFRDSADTRRKLRDAGFAEDFKNSGYYAFPGVNLERFCRILGIAIPFDYRQS